jgi:hypothetical protein
MTEGRPMLMQGGEAGAVAGPTGFRWRLAGPPGPPMTLALVIAEAVCKIACNNDPLRGVFRVQK